VLFRSTVDETARSPVTNAPPDAADANRIVEPG
jgi:hypothetical protein